MSGLIEQLGTLRAVGVDGDERQLQLLLRTAGYNVERAINHYFESGLPGPPRGTCQESTTPTPSPPPPLPPPPADGVASVSPRPSRGSPTNSTSQGLPTKDKDAVGRSPANGAGRLHAAPARKAAAGNKEVGWPKLVGQRWVTGYTISKGSMKYREKITIISEGSGSSSRSSPPPQVKGNKGRGAGKGGGAQAKLWAGRGAGRGGGGGGGRFGRPKASSAGAMSNILFRGSTGRVEGRLPREVCAFLAPLLQEGLVKAHAEAVCDLPGLGKFAEVPLMLSVEIEEGLFALDPEEELYRNAYCLLQFAHTGHIEQEQPKSQQAAAAAAEKGKADHQQAERTLAKGERNEVEEEQEEEEEEVREEDVKELYDDETQLCEMAEARDPRLFVDGLALRRYQRQALAWMIQREKKRYVTEEDCTGLSSVTAAAAAADAGEGAVEEESGGGGGGGVAVRDGRVRVASWGGASSANTKHEGSGDCGGGPGVAMHPLWERRAAASIVVRKDASGDCLDLFGGCGMDDDDDDDNNAGGGGEKGAPQLVLSQPEAFFVNVYSRRFQREFPPASLGCRGGILADEMGMGKTVMLLSLILSDKERRQEGGCGSNGVGDCGEEEDDEKGQEEGGGPAAVGRDGSLVVCLDDDDDESASAAEHDSKGKQKLGSGSPDGRNAATSSTPEDALATADLPSRGKRRSPAVTEAVPSSAGSVAAGTKRRRAAAAAVRLDVSSSDDGGGGGSSGGESDFMPTPESSDGGGSGSGSDGDSDFEPTAGKGKSRAVAANGGPSKRRRGETGKRVGANGKGRSGGGRWGGGKAGSDPSALLLDPYAAGAQESNGGERVASGRGAGKGGGTLVVCPLSLIGQWRGELESKTRKGAISVGFHYGAGRSRSTRELCRKDVVLTTYGVLSSEMAKHEADATARESTALATTGGGGGGSATPAGGLLGVRWSRVILDEAHSIRNTNTEQSRACLRLEADQRWAVTGTPIQNSLDDMAALLAFLRHEPWSDRGWWRKVISDPYKDGDAEALRRLKTVLAPILLRRTKSTLDSRGRPIVELPPKTVEIVRLQLSAEEREFYEALKKRSKIEFEGYVAAGTVMKSYIAILTLLLRLRQACNHPFLVLGKGFSLAPSSVSSVVPPGARRNQPGAAGAAAAANNESETLFEGGVAEGGAGGKSPPDYVQELYRRYRERVAGDNDGRKEGGDVEETEGVGGTGGSDGLPSQGGGAGSLAFVDSVVDQLRDDGEMAKEECPVCLEEPMSSPALTPCAHLMCLDCLRDCLRREACCPVCRSPMTTADIIEVAASQTRGKAVAAPRKPPSSIPSKGAAATGSSSSSSSSSSNGGAGARAKPAPRDTGGGGGGWVGSTKLARLELELREMRKKTPGAKAVVFSQWTHMLDLAEASIARGGWTFRRLDGAMSQQQRESALKGFATDESVTVMLVSLKAGGVGLNLTAASTVILLDPWWNPAVEEQAIDRIHRLGQLNEVSVKRFVVSGTVEDKMLALQEVKGRMAKNALAAGSVNESQKLRVEDLIQFFK